MDWIKVEKGTPEKPEMLALARHLGVSQAEAFLLCFRFWAWADSHCLDGGLVGITEEQLDVAIAHRRGFAQGLLQIGWLSRVLVGEDSVGHLAITHFDKHLGQGAKKRASDLERQKRKRVTNLSRSERDKSVTPSISYSSSDSTLEGNGVLGEGETCAENPSGWLGRIWAMHTQRKRGGCKQDAPEDAAPIMEVLLNAGFSQEEIEQAIKSRADNTEYLWQFKQRLLDTKGQTGNGKPKRLTAKESVARRREKEAESA